jgi:hypothetical protein
VSRALIVTLLGVLGVGASAALWVGVQEARLARIGARHDYAAEELSGATRGWVAVFGCVRHDRAVAVTSDGRVYALGMRLAGASDQDRVFTPLSARDDCDEARAPRAIYALIEDDDGLSNTLGRIYQNRVAPPPVPAFVEGVIGYGAGSAGAARRAAAQLGVDLGRAPLLAKGRRPGVFWVAVVTAAAGVHGYALIAVVVLWARRRRRKNAERGHFSDEENAFYDDQA